MVEFLLAHGASATYIDDDGRTALHLALTGSARATMKDIEQVLYLLLKSGSNPYQADRRNVTVSYYACWEGSAYRVNIDGYPYGRCETRQNGGLVLRRVWTSALVEAGYDAERVISESLGFSTCLNPLEFLHWHCPECDCRLIKARWEDVQLRICDQCSEIIYSNTRTVCNLSGCPWPSSKCEEDYFLDSADVGESSYSDTKGSNSAEDDFLESTEDLENEFEEGNFGLESLEVSEAQNGTFEQTLDSEPWGTDIAYQNLDDSIESSGFPPKTEWSEGTSQQQHQSYAQAPEWATLQEESRIWQLE